jgi:2'-5' RNA ligase
MKACFALLPGLSTQNAAMALGWDLHVRHGAGIEVRKIPPHVSLKQSFDAPALPDLLDFMEAFAATLHPVTAVFDVPAVWPWPSAADPRSGVLVLTVRENAELRALHDRLNAELVARFGECPAEFDGDAYVFHLTLVAGGLRFERYQEVAQGLGNFPAACRLEALALFVFDPSGGAYTTYRILPLS